MAVNATVKVLRFDSTIDAEPYYKEYQIKDYDTTAGPLTALKALHWINLHIEPIAYDYNCRRTSCGMCGMMVNGESKLACRTPIDDGETVTLDPLAGFPVVRDLIVDTERAHRRFVQSSASIKTSSPDKVLQPVADGEFWWNEISHHSTCRECMLCYSSCMALQPGNKWDKFAGPGALHQIYMRHIDGIDESDRIAQAVEMGLFECVQCGMCTKVCPARIPTKENNKKMMDIAEERSLKPQAESTSYWPMV